MSSYIMFETIFCAFSHIRGKSFLICGFTSLPNFLICAEIFPKFFYQTDSCRRENPETLERIPTILFEQFKHI